MVQRRRPPLAAHPQAAAAAAGWLALPLARLAPRPQGRQQALHPALAALAALALRQVPAPPPAATGRWRRCWQGRRAGARPLRPSPERDWALGPARQPPGAARPLDAATGRLTRPETVRVWRQEGYSVFLARKCANKAVRVKRGPMRLVPLPTSSILAFRAHCCTCIGIAELRLIALGPRAHLQPPFTTRPCPEPSTGSPTAPSADQ